MTETKVVGRITDEELPKWAQSSESKGQFYRKSIQEMAALREQLAALREGLAIPIIQSAADTLSKLNDSPTEPLDGLITQLRWVASELQSLLTQPTPTVNSAEAVNGGEDSGGGA